MRVIQIFCQIWNMKFDGYLKYTICTLTVIAINGRQKLELELSENANSVSRQKSFIFTQPEGSLLPLKIRSWDDVNILLRLKSLSHERVAVAVVVKQWVGPLRHLSRMCRPRLRQFTPFLSATASVWDPAPSQPPRGLSLFFHLLPPLTFDKKHLVHPRQDIETHSNVAKLFLQCNFPVTDNFFSLSKQFSIQLLVVLTLSAASLTSAPYALFHVLSSMFCHWVLELLPVQSDIIIIL